MVMTLSCAAMGTTLNSVEWRKQWATPDKQHNEMYASLDGHWCHSCQEASRWIINGRVHTLVNMILGSLNWTLSGKLVISVQPLQFHKYKKEISGVFSICQQSDTKSRAPSAQHDQYQHWFPNLHCGRICLGGSVCLLEDISLGYPIMLIRNSPLLEYLSSMRNIIYRQKVLNIVTKRETKCSHQASINTSLTPSGVCGYSWLLSLHMSRFCWMASWQYCIYRIKYWIIWNCKNPAGKLGCTVFSIEFTENSPTQVMFLPTLERRSSQHAVLRAKAPELCTMK